MQIELNDAEATVLEELLESVLSEMRSEISHTDDRDFKSQLRERRDTVQSILERISAGRSG